jgi:hypothetical protein
MKQLEIDWKGGEILWLEEELDVNNSIDSQIAILREDLIAVRFGNSVFLDLGWFPEFDLRGQFLLTVVQAKDPENPTGDDWENPVLEIKFRNMSQFMLNLNQAIETANRLATI